MQTKKLLGTIIAIYFLITVVSPIFANPNQTMQPNQLAAYQKTNEEVDQITEEIRQYVRTTYGIVDLSDKALDVLLGETFEGIPYFKYIGLFIEADKVYEDLANGKSDQAMQKIAVWSFEISFLEGLSSIGLHSAATLASLAALPINYGINEFKEAVMETSFNNQIILYSMARDRGYRHDKILAGGISTGNIHMEHGWIVWVADENGVVQKTEIVPRGLEPADVFEVAKITYKLESYQQEYEQDKVEIGESLIEDAYIPTEKILSVPYYSQGSTAWCVPVSMSMIFKYYYGAEKNIHSWDIAQEWNWDRDIQWWQFFEPTYGMIRDYFNNHGLKTAEKISNAQDFYEIKARLDICQLSSICVV